MRSWRCFLLAVFVTVGIASLGPAVSSLRANPRSLPTFADAYVNDHSNLLPRYEKEALRQRLTALHAETGLHCLVLTVTSLAHFGYQKQSADLFAKRCLEASKAGPHAILLLIAVKERLGRARWGAAVDQKRGRAVKRQLLVELRKRWQQLGRNEAVVETIDVCIGLLEPVPWYQSPWFLPGLALTACLTFLYVAACVEAGRLRAVLRVTFGMVLLPLTLFLIGPCFYMYGLMTPFIIWLILGLVFLEYLRFKGALQDWVSLWRLIGLDS